MPAAGPEPLDEVLISSGSAVSYCRSPWVPARKIPVTRRVARGALRDGERLDPVCLATEPGEGGQQPTPVTETQMILLGARH